MSEIGLDAIRLARVAGHAAKGGYIAACGLFLGAGGRVPHSNADADRAIAAPGISLKPGLALGHAHG